MQLICIVDEQLTSTASMESIPSSGTKSPMPQIEEPLPDYDMELKEDEPEYKPSPRLSSKKPQPKAAKSQLYKSSSKDKLENATEKEGDNVSKSKLGRTRTSSSNRDSSPEKNTTPEFTKIVLKKTASSDKSDTSPAVSPTRPADGKDQGIETASEGGKTTGVVMRQKSSSSQDTSKRQTIAGVTAVSGTPSGEKTTTTPFGERKLNKRSSWMESNRKWDDFDKKEQKKGDSEVGQGDASKSEFTQMFSKFQRRASQKKDVSVKVIASDKQPDGDTAVSVDDKSSSGAKTTTTTTTTPSSLKSVPSTSIAATTTSSQPQVCYSEIYM